MYWSVWSTMIIILCVCVCCGGGALSRRDTPPYKPVGVVSAFLWGSRWCRTLGTPAPSGFRSMCRCVCERERRKMISAPPRSPHTLQSAVVGVACRGVAWWAWSGPSSHSPAPDAVCRSRSVCSERYSLPERLTLWPRPLASPIRRAPPPNNSAQTITAQRLERKTSH